MSRIATCSVCGKEFIAKHHMNTICSKECKQIRNSEHYANRKKRIENNIPVDPKYLKKGTLCWSCQNATNSGCSWSRSLTPVEGWVATKSYSYSVKSCPEYIQDEPVKRVEECDE